MISVVVPVKNEEDNIAPLAAEIADALDNSPWDWECLWIDDYSTDSTPEKIAGINAEKQNHKLVKHLGGYGQSAALATGFGIAEGNIIATLDGDGQNDPADIPKLVRKLLDEDADMVNGWRQNRRDSIVRKLSSKIANAYRNILTGEKIRDVGCAIRVFKKECFHNIPVFKGMHRFFPTLVRIAGHDKIIEEPVNHRPRERGKTKYGINNRLWVGIADTFAVCWMRWRMVFPKSEVPATKEPKKKRKSGKAEKKK